MYACMYNSILVPRRTVTCFHCVDSPSYWMPMPRLASSKSMPFNRWAIKSMYVIVIVIVIFLVVREKNKYYMYNEWTIVAVVIERWWYCFLPAIYFSFIVSAFWYIYKYVYIYILAIHCIIAIFRAIGSPFFGIIYPQR